MEILKAKNLTKIYGNGDTEVRALDNLSLSIQKGEFVSIVGASGSGKSTLLHMFGGVDYPNEGSIFIDGTDVTTMDETERAIFRRRKVGLIYQFFNLIPTLNVEKNILLPILLDGKKPNAERFNQVIGMLGLDDRLNHMPNELSGGQQQRVAIGRALISQPSIILADEPTGNLDKKNSESIMNMLKLCNCDYNQTIILITHDEKVARQASRMITIEDGKILSDEVLI